MYRKGEEFMNRNIVRLICMVLCGAMLLSFASCKKAKTPAKKPVVSAPTVESQDSESSDNLPTEEDFFEENDAGDIDGDYIQQDSYEIIVERPETAGLISRGVKLDYAFDDEEEEELEGDVGIDNDFFIDEDIDLDEIAYTPLIQKHGEKVDGATRNITVDNSTDGIYFTDFSGLSTNVFPTGTSLAAQNVAGDGEAFLESNGERFNDVAYRYARAWFQIDWIVTEEAGDDWVKYKDNPEGNPDYKNYINGIYCFSEGQKNTDLLNSAINYFKMLEEAGTEVYLAFGWKVNARVHDWFGVQPNKPVISAPRDLKAYAKAAAALFKYMRKEVGLTNFNTLSFYNEPDRSEGLSYQGSWDYSCLGDKCVYWAAMAREAQKEFDKHADLRDVLIMGADCSNDMVLTTDDHVNPYIRNNAPDVVDCYTFHYYGYSKGNGQTYDNFFDKSLFVYNYYEKPCYITEYYTAQYDIPKDIPDGEAASYIWTDWNRSLGSLYIAMANTGVRGGFKWTAVVGILPDSNWGGSESEEGNKSWMRPVSIKSINKMYHGFYQEAMLNNYVPNNANVHNISWTGDDIRASAFTSKDGKDFSLVVEANEKSPKRNLKVDLEKALNKNVYVFRYGFDQICDGNAIIPQCEHIIKNVGKEFIYDVDGEYGIYVFTTIKPLKQVTLFEKGTDTVGTAFELKKGESVTVEPHFIDCNGNETVKWEIKRSNGAIKSTKSHRENFMENNKYLTRGTLTQKGNDMTYTVGDNAETGDIISIRCTIVDGDKNVNNDRYAVTTIFVK